jgi:hypothetical protein
MPDNVTAPATGAIFATDEVGGAHYPYTKLVWGADNTATLVADANGARLPVVVGGSLPAFAATPTFDLSAGSLAALENTTVSGTVELGATTLAALENTTVTVGAPLPAGTNNIGDVDVLSVPVTATTTRAYDYAAGQRITTAGAGQVRSAAVAATEVLLHPSVRGFFRVGDSAVAAGVAAGSIPLAADEKFHLRITSGQFISFIRDGATDGSLSIVPVA